MIEQFLFNALIGGFFLALISGTLGPFVIWNKMSYFGDALSHSALLGVALGILLGINLSISIAIIASAFAIIFSKNESTYSNDTTLGILSYSALSSAVIIASLNQIKIDMMSYLFGDILAINLVDLAYLFICSLITIIWIKKNWSNLVMMSLCPELLKSEGVSISKLKLKFSLILALFIAISFKIVGILLITALLILPSAIALPLSQSPRKMLINSIVFGLISVIIGIYTALYWDIPTGPSIIIISSIMFLAVNLFLKRS